MKLNLLASGARMTFGPGQRLSLLTRGLDALGVEYEFNGKDYSQAIGLHGDRVFLRWEELPVHVPIGPNVFHTSREHLPISEKFDNFIVQSEWVKDFWTWDNPKFSKNIHVWPAGIDVDFFSSRTKNITHDCLYYTKYQNTENEKRVTDMLDKHKQSYSTVRYGKYDYKDFPEMCSHFKYAVFQSCCEKSPHVLLEMLACGLPVYVLDSKRWIGDDKFDRATSAPYFDERCGEKCSGEERFPDFLCRTYSPRDFVVEGFTYIHSTQILVDIMKGILCL
jgi:hypothetical protein